jgi:hypothetical protein
MPFEKDQELNPDGTPKVVDPKEPVVDPTLAPAAAPNDHNQVFLVAGERAFRDAESVVKNIENAQAHITTLEAERVTDREALATAQAEVARLKKIEDGLDGRQSGNDDRTDQMSIEQVAAQAADMAVGKIAQSKTVAEQTKNLADSEAKAEAAYGKDYLNKISEIATNLNMTLKAVDELGKSSPSAFARLFLPASPGQPHQPTTSTVLSPADSQQNRDPAKPVNIVKMRERDRMSTVAALMKDAGVAGY